MEMKKSVPFKTCARKAERQHGERTGTRAREPRARPRAVASRQEVRLWQLEDHPTASWSTLTFWSWSRLSRKDAFGSTSASALRVRIEQTHRRRPDEKLVFRSNQRRD
eukprot:2466086-Rhodomonas_salina.1